MHTTKGHTSRWNDKTLAYHEEFLMGIKEGRILRDCKFNLLSWQGVPGRSEVKSTEYKGAWGITDNGYHKWSITQAPAKTRYMRVEERLSQFLESFRKDSESVFGILKGRWRVLQTGIRLHGAATADKVWLTCCALHNMLLTSDSLAEEWTGALGINDPEEMRTKAPFPLRRLDDRTASHFGSRQHEIESDARVDTSGRCKRRRRQQRRRSSRCKATERRGRWGNCC